MKKLTSYLSLLAVVSVISGGISPANAALSSVGAPSPVHGLPLWYQDVSGLALKPCLDQTPTAGGTSLCVLPPNFDPDPAVAGLRTPPNAAVTPITTTPPISAANFPDEVFYWIADVVHDTPLVTGNLTGRPAKLVLRMALEGNALAPALTFMRINIQQMDGLAPNGTYSVSTPYGDISFTADALGEVKDAAFNGQTFRNQIDAFPPLFDAILPAIFPAIPPQQAAAITMDQFLVWNPAVLPAAPVGFVGDPQIPHSVVKSGDVAPAVVTFSGTGLPLQTITQMSISGQMIGLVLTPPASTDFGVIKTNSTSAPMAFTLRNLTGNVMTPIFTFAPPAAGFVVDPGTCPGVVGGATCTFNVTFTPTAEGAQTATLTVSHPTAPPVTATVSGTGDGVAPTLALVNPNLFTNDTTPAISGTVADNNGVGGVQVQVDLAAPVAASVTGNTWTFTVPTALAEGPHTIAITANDIALPAPGNLAQAVNGTITVDTVLPVITLTAPVAGTTTDNTPTLTFDVADTNAVTTTVKVDGTLLNPTPVSNTALAALADGSHTVLVESTDAAGNVAVSKQVTLTVDTTVSPFTLAAVTTPTRTNTQTIGGTVEAGSTVTVALGTATPVNATVTGTTWTYNIPALAEGVNNITVAGTDSLGNATTLPASSIKVVLPDGKITGAATVAIADALKSLQFAAGLTKPTAEETLHADVAPLVGGVPAPDGKVDIGDVVLILRKAVGLVNF